MLPHHRLSNYKFENGGHYYRCVYRTATNVKEFGEKMMGKFESKPRDFFKEFDKAYQERDYQKISEIYPHIPDLVRDRLCDDSLEELHFILQHCPSLLDKPMILGRFLSNVSVEFLGELYKEGFPVYDEIYRLIDRYESPKHYEILQRLDQLI